MSGRQYKSEVWRYFEKTSDKVTCKVWGEDVKTSCSNTSNLLLHMRTNYSNLVNGGSQSTQQPKLSFFGIGSTKPCPPCHQDVITNLIIIFIAENLITFAIVESESFCRLIEILDPATPCRAGRQWRRACSPQKRSCRRRSKPTWSIQRTYT